ncbi:glycosyltransferase [Portibacter marinus]|uniref:glycosyltransferase n=1 Tax=Portibacter marinus TaxID=2898660 RepID=UPI001F402066|nr:glycosyltransferase [Portibacter marinus]
MKIGIIATEKVPVGVNNLVGKQKITDFIVTELCDRGHEVVTLCKIGSHVKGSMMNYVESEEVVEGAYTIVEVADLMTSMRKFLEYGFDVIHNHSDNPLVIIIGNYLNIPFITTFHMPVLQDISYALMAIKDQINQEFTSVNSILANEYSKYVDHIQIIRNGIDIDQWKYYDQDDEPYLSWTGRIERGKGLEQIIDLCIKFNHRLKFAGPIIDFDFWESGIEEKVEQNDLIQYFGCVHEKYINQLVGQSAAYIFTRKSKYSYGLTIIESLACGTPIIAMNNEMTKEFIDENIGILIDLDQESEFLEGIKSVKNINRKKCLEKAANYCCHKQMVDQYEGLYMKFMVQKAKAV